MSEAIRKKLRYKFDPEVFPPLPESVLLALKRQDFWGLGLVGKEPWMTGWRYIEPCAQLAFDEWRISGCSPLVFGEWMKELTTLAVPIIVGERKHLNSVVQANLLLDCDPSSDLHIKSLELHGARVNALKGFAVPGQLTSVDWAVVQAWKELQMQRDSSAGPDSLRSIDKKESPSSSRRNWVDQVIGLWTEQTKRPFTRTDIWRMAGYQAAKSFEDWQAGRVKGDGANTNISRVLNYSAEVAFNEVGKHSKRKAA